MTATVWRLACPGDPMLIRPANLLTILALTTIIGGPPSRALGQQLQFGLVGGTNLTPDFHATDQTFTIAEPGQPGYQLNVLLFSRTHSLIVGPMMELSLPWNFSVEVDALYRTLHSTQVVTNLFPDGIRQSTTDQLVSARTWEFPVLLKYALLVSRFRPFVELGPSFRVWQDPQGVALSNHGVTAGLGTEMNWGNLKFAPAVRYTRWASDAAYQLRPANPDQMELLGSVSYRTASGSRRLAGHKIWLGLVAGTSLTDGFHLGMFDPPQVESRPYVAGLSAELELGERLSLEVDGLYRPLHATPNPDTSPFRSPFTVLTWEFPVLARYRLTASKFAPFAEAGPSVRASGNNNGYAPSRFGATGGGGVEVKAGTLRLSPAVRYTRWAKDQSTFGTPQVDYPRTAANQVETLVGVSF